MKLTMLSHASVLVEAGSVAICADPWFMGEAFNESWSLLCEPALTSAGLQGVTHIWISHEHPDHLHYPTLKAIPAEQRQRSRSCIRAFSLRMCRALANLGFRRGRVAARPLV
jgi:L-ascorbate metabolism protein UlaG (beta-lactamase superfamily)